MATAYTSLLGLALPVTGELSGTWGDTVNNSITSLLDSAIAGTTTLNTDADVTLTTTTGAANTAREAILLWTAGGTVTRNITAPAQSKAYIVINASSSTQSIVLRGVGPTTGVTIVQGEKAVCAWNGTDFIKVSNISGAGSFTNLSYTGTLTGGTGIVNLGSGQFYKDSSGNVGIGTSSPTRKLNVSATGTSIIGSFARTDGANAYVTFADNTTTSDTYVGVGAAANDLFVRAGNAERMRVTSAGNVGIGTSSPATILHVANTGSSGVQSIRLENSEGYAQISTDSNLATYDAQLHLFNNRARSTEYMRISSTGGLSVGTTSDPGAGAIYATGNITAYFSDDRLKTKLGNIQDALSKVKALSGFYYEANQTAQDLGYKPVREAGVSAQQVQAVMPEVVKPAPIDAQYLTVDYERLVPLLIEAIKELDAKVEGLVKA